MKTLTVVLFLIVLSFNILYAQYDDNVAKARNQAVKAMRMIRYSSSQTHDIGVSSNLYDRRSSFRPANSSPQLHSTRERSISNYNNYGTNSDLDFYNNPPVFNNTRSRYSPLDEAIILLKDCQKLDPACIMYPLELGFAYYLDQQYHKSIKYLERLQYDSNVSATVFQLLGKCYLLNKDEKNGLKKHWIEVWVFFHMQETCTWKKDSITLAKGIRPPLFTVYKRFKS